MAFNRLEPSAASPAPFHARFERLRVERGPFCLGLDPSPDLLRTWALPDDATGLRAMCLQALDAAGDRVGVFKPQSAYFERFGAAGLEVLAEVITAIHARGSLALLDAKRGDIGSTNAAYAAGLLGPGSALCADAITLHPYLGLDALAPFFERAQATGCAVFVVVLSSNLEGRTLQHATVAPGHSVAQYLSAQITTHNRRLLGAGGGAIGPIGAVLGLTAASASELVAELPLSLLLVPGLGAQGGSFDELAARFSAAKSRVLPNASRSVLAHGPSPAALRQAIAEHCHQASHALG